MKKLDHGATSRRRRGSFASSDELARRQRRIIFAAFGRGEEANGLIVKLPGPARQRHGPSVSVRPVESPGNVVGFPLPAIQRRKA